MPHIVSDTVQTCFVPAIFHLSTRPPSLLLTNGTGRRSFSSDVALRNTSFSVVFPHPSSAINHRKHQGPHGRRGGSTCKEARAITWRPSGPFLLGFAQESP